MSSAKAIALITRSGQEFRVTGETSAFGVVHKQQIDESSSFDLASITKLLATTTILMRAIESGQISLSDRVGGFIPDWSLGEKSEITIEDLLRHESGLEEWRPFYISCASPEEAYSMIAGLPLKYPIRREFHYSDLNFIVLGQLVSVIFGGSIEEIFKAEVARPIGLSSTGFAVPVDMNNVVATSIGDSIERRMVESKVPYDVPEKAADFLRWRSEVLAGEINDGNSFHLFNGISGHAGLFSTLADLTRYIRALLDGFIAMPILNAFSQPRNFLDQGIGFKRFALPNGGYAIGHFGFTGTGFAIDLAKGTGLVYLSNRLHTHGEYRPMAELWSDEFKEFSSRD